MTSLGLSRYAVSSCAAAALLAACGGSQPPLGMPAVAQHRMATPLLAPTTSRGQQPASASGYAVLFNFGEFGTRDRGAFPIAALIGVRGTLYGTTSKGGTVGYGTVFSITPSGKERVLHSFDENSDGAYPAAALISVKGMLYGTTSAGGTYNDGTVFSMDEAGSNFRVLHTFVGGTDGKQPTAGLTAVQGWLYGTTAEGGGGTTGNGTVFAVRLRDGKERIVHRFRGSDGGFPTAPLTYRSGILYGTTVRGGRYSSSGTVFSLDIATARERVLHSFDGTDGAFPQGGVLVTLNGTLYGTTSLGAYNNSGTVFSLTARGTEHILHRFGYGHDGKQPEAGLTVAGGRLFGTTYYGGTTGYGTIFEIETRGHETIVHNFGGGYFADGLFPSAPLLAVNDKLYGTTYIGGRHPQCSTSYFCSYGTVFVLNR